METDLGAVWPERMESFLEEMVVDFTQAQRLIDLARSMNPINNDWSARTIAILRCWVEGDPTEQEGSGEHFIVTHGNAPLWSADRVSLEMLLSCHARGAIVVIREIVTAIETLRSYAQETVRVIICQDNQDRILYILHIDNEVLRTSGNYLDIVRDLEKRN
jgi:hypothetical protein